MFKLIISNSYDEENYNIDWKSYGVQAYYENSTDKLIDKVKEIAPTLIVINSLNNSSDILNKLSIINKNSSNINCIVISNNRDLKFIKSIAKFNIFSYITPPFIEFQLLKEVVILKEKLDTKTFNTSNTQNKLISYALNYIHTNYNDYDLTLDSVASFVYITPVYLSTLFKKEIGVNFLDYIHKYRTEKSKDLLNNKKYAISKIALMVGYSSEKLYSSKFKKYNNITPKQYRQFYMN